MQQVYLWVPGFIRLQYETGGGIIGGMPALGGGTEHQLLGAPHYHAEGHIACMYQYGTLADVARRIEANRSIFEDILKYSEVLHRTSIIEKEVYDEFRPRVEGAFQERFASEEHDDMCTIPKYIGKEISASDVLVLGTADVSLEDLQLEGAAFRRNYLRDAQYIFSRVQHHVHHKTEAGYVPLSYCMKRTDKRKGKKTQASYEVQAGFPHGESAH